MKQTCFPCLQHTANGGKSLKSVQVVQLFANKNVNINGKPSLNIIRIFLPRQSSRVASLEQFQEQNRHFFYIKTSILVLKLFQTGNPAVVRSKTHKIKTTAYHKSIILAPKNVKPVTYQDCQIIDRWRPATWSTFGHFLKYLEPAFFLRLPEDGFKISAQ